MPAEAFSRSGSASYPVPATSSRRARSTCPADATPSKSAKPRARADRTAVRHTQAANLEIVPQSPCLLACMFFSLACRIKDCLRASAVLATAFVPEVDQVGRVLHELPPRKTQKLSSPLAGSPT